MSLDSGKALFIVVIDIFEAHNTLLSIILLNNMVRNGENTKTPKSFNMPKVDNKGHFKASTSYNFYVF